MPILLYGLECVDLPKSTLRSIENAYNQVYSKLFYTYDNLILKQCKFYMGYLPMELKIANRKLNFLSKISSASNLSCSMLDKNSAELQYLISFYGIEVFRNFKKVPLNSLNTVNFRNYLFSYFEKDIWSIDLHSTNN